MSATLASLRIRNLALVEDILWEPPSGFVAITGETGAGKSMIIGALKLLLGDRADKGLIRSGASSCTVEAVFEGMADLRIADLLEDNGAEPVEEGRLLLKRTLSAEGAGRQFANGSPCTLTLLRSIGNLLVDLHGPHDHQSLFSREQQTRLLDSFAGSLGLQNEYAAVRHALIALENEQETILAEEQSAAREIELLEHQVREIGDAALSPAEETELVSRQLAASNSQRIGELCGQLEAAVSDDDDSLSAKFAVLVRISRELSRLDPAAGKFLTESEAISEALREFSGDLQSYTSRLEIDPARLAEIETRLDVIQSLKRKYGTTVEEVLLFGDTASARLAELRGRSERKGNLDGEIRAARAKRDELAAKLGAQRKGAAPKLATKVRSELKGLGFAKAEFSIDLELLAEPGPHGAELAEFLFCPNPGEAAQPLRSIASSGEISRVMLALKAALATQDDVPVLVFDEIDANVGGEIAAKVGEKMKSLGSRRQVLCITHLPQVAASAAAQFVVRKEVSGNRTQTLLASSSGKSREEEIARMLGGKTDSALAHARTLLSVE